jgi:acetate kinase
MKILVANLGSTSFKYRLFDMGDERELARGAVDRIGANPDVPNHAAAVRQCLNQLVEGRYLNAPADLTAIGFKAVHARGLTGAHRVDEKVLEAMEAYNGVAPAHNPSYVRAMRLLLEKVPHIPLVAAFETAFHETISPADRLYAVPLEWAQDHGIKRWGFHGASHRYIAERTGQLLNNPAARIISCHLGGSSSVCAIQNGVSVANSFGFSPQSGLPHNNRVGDFDPFALPAVMRATGKTLDQALDDLAHRAGLLGVSGISNDLRDLEMAMRDGNARARLALEVFTAAVRHYLGAYLLRLGGAEAIVFTGGIGENSHGVRSAVCQNLDWFGILLDPVRNREARGEMAVHAINSRVQIWTVPTNEELIVAREVKSCIAPKEPLCS